MKRLDYFSLIAGLFHFKNISDEKGNEFVFFTHVSNEPINNVNDRTEFEALENHVHLLDRVKKEEFSKLFPIAEKLGNALLNALKFNYPSKNFIVFVTIDLHDAFIIRFHQKWDGEPPYYNPSDFISPNTRVFMFKS
jgi:hypothetical protein